MPAPAPVSASGLLPAPAPAAEAARDAPPATDAADATAAAAFAPDLLLAAASGPAGGTVPAGTGAGSAPPATGAAASSPKTAPGAGTPAAAEMPVYRTRLPPPLLLAYDLRRGPLSGSGTLDWQPDGDRYTARLEGKVLGVSVMVLESRGTIDANGIAPVRYTDARRGRGTQAANFRRTVGGSGGKITYSGPSDEVPLPRGAQDRLTWMVQLAAVGAADPARVGPGGKVSMFVSGARADADVWTFAHVATEPLAIGERTLSTLHLVREPRGEHDTRAEVWLDPARHYLPVRARLSNGQGSDAGDAFELTLKP